MQFISGARSGMWHVTGGGVSLNNGRAVGVEIWGPKSPPQSLRRPQREGQPPGGGGGSSCGAARACDLWPLGRVRGMSRNGNVFM